MTTLTSALSAERAPKTQSPAPQPSVPGRFTAEPNDLQRRIITPEAMLLITSLHERFGAARADLLETRRHPFPGQPRPDTAHIRANKEWQVASPARGLTRRWAELCLPATPEGADQARTSGADVWVADLEDSLSPTWQNLLTSQEVLARAAREYEHHHPTIMMRPRGLHLEEPQVRVDGTPVAASLVDVGLFFHHCARTLRDRGSGPYLYLPKVESAAEARWWNDLLTHLEDGYRLPRGNARAAILIETLPAALELEEILYELRHHAAGLNAGRWDYLFSVLKTLRAEGVNLPDCTTITMTTSFMAAFTGRLIGIAHRRGTHAIGPLAANVVQADSDRPGCAQQRVRADKSQEAAAGFDGSWVGNSELVGATRGAFADGLKGSDHQFTRPHHSMPSWSELTKFSEDGTAATWEGLRANIGICLRYLNAWLQGEGAVEIDGVIEDASAVEICHLQVWQWTRTGAKLEEGMVVTENLIRRIASAETKRIAAESPRGTSKLALAAQLFCDGVVGPFDDFLMARAYREHLR